jgi:hypothetical protein
MEQAAVTEQWQHAPCSPLLQGVALFFGQFLGVAAKGRRLDAAGGACERFSDGRDRLHAFLDLRISMGAGDDSFGHDRGLIFLRRSIVLTLTHAQPFGLSLKVMVADAQARL